MFSSVPELLSAWAPAFPSLLLALCGLFAPGMFLGASMRLRGRMLLIASPLLSVFLSGSGAVLAPLIGIRWGWGFLAGYTAVVTGLVFGVSWLLRGRSTPYEQKPSPAWLWPEVVGGVALGGSITTWGAFHALVFPDAPVQTWDGAFHLSAAQYVYVTGDGSTLHLGRLATGGTGTAFYPAGWHDLVALTMPFSGDAILASNVVALAIMALIWPLGMALLVNALFPNQRFAPLVAALLAAASTAFPERVASYGTLWPVLLAYALVPYALAVAADFFGGKVFRPRPALMFVLVAGLIGMGIVHPQGVLAFLVLGIWFVLAMLIRVLRNPASSDLAGKILLYAALPVLVIGIFVISRSSAGQSTLGWGGRSPVDTIEGALVGAIIDAQMSGQGYGNEVGIWLFAVLLVAGIVALVVLKTRRWLMLSWVAAVYLFVSTATLALPGYFLSGFWYYDPVRMGAIVPLASIPIMALGAAWGADGLLALVQTRLGWTGRTAGIAVGAFTTVLVFVATYSLGFNTGSHQIWINYQYKDETGLNGLAGPEELDMIKRVAEELPDDAVVIGSPFSGVQLLFAATGTDSYFKIYVPPMSEDARYLAENFDNLNSDPRVCEILENEGIEYFYSDDIFYRLDPEHEKWYPALEDPGDLLDQFEYVDSGGSASVYRIVGCD